MRRIKLVLAVGAVMVAMVALTAGPAMADEFDHEFFVVEDFNEEVVFIEEDEGLFDALCSPGIDIDLAGCIFSDEEDEDFLDEDEFDFVLADYGDFFDDDEVIFFVDDIDFDNDLDFKDFDNDNRSGNFVG